MSAGIDIKEWQAAVRDFAQQSSRELPDIINRSAGSISLKALMGTKRVDRDDIRDALVTAGKVDFRKGKRGQWKATVSKEFTGLAYALAQKRKLGEQGKALEQRVRKLVNARIRSVGFLASGWLPCIDKFRKWMKGYGRPDLRKRGKRPLGEGVVATESLKPVATVENFVGAKNSQAVSAFGKAMAAESAQLRTETARRLQNIANRSKKKGN